MALCEKCETPDAVACSIGNNVVDADLCKDCSREWLRTSIKDKRFIRLTYLDARLELLRTQFAGRHEANPSNQLWALLNEREKLENEIIQTALDWLDTGHYCGKT